MAIRYLIVRLIERCHLYMLPLIPPKHHNYLSEDLDPSKPKCSGKVSATMTTAASSLLPEPIDDLTPLSSRAPSPFVDRNAGDVMGDKNLLLDLPPEVSTSPRRLGERPADGDGNRSST